MTMNLWCQLEGNVEKWRQRRSRHFVVLTHQRTLRAPSPLRRSDYEGRECLRPFLRQAQDRTERTPRFHEGMLFEHPLWLFGVIKDVKDQFHFEKFQFFQKSI